METKGYQTFPGYYPTAGMLREARNQDKSEQDLQV